MITNIKECYQNVVDRYEESGFELSFKKETDDVLAIAAKKTIKSIADNFCENGDNFVLATGSLIYNESLDYKGILDTKDGIESIRNNSIGHYAVSLKKGSKITVWGDAIGVYDIFYYHKEDKFLVSNSLYDMAKSLGDRVSVNELNLLEEVFLYSILGGETIYNEIGRLSGDESIEINLTKGTLAVVPVNNELPSADSISYKDAVDGFVNSLNRRANTIFNLFGNPCISMTGGLDARISLASYLSCGSKPTLAYGVGDTCFTNTKMDDLYIDRKFKEKFNLDLIEGDWSTPTPLDKYWDKYIRKYGFSARAYMASDKVVEYLESTPGNILTFGYGGELFRNLDWTESSKTNNFTIDEYLDGHYYRFPLTKQILEIIPELREHIRNKLLKICSNHHLNPDKIKKEDVVLLQLEYRKYADSVMLNYVNQMKYSFLLLFEYDSIKYSRIKTTYMKNSKYMLEVIDQLYSDVLTIPVFSHCQQRIFNRRKMILQHVYSNILKRKLKFLISPIKKTIPSSIIDKIKKNKTASKDSTRNDEIRRFVIENRNYIPLAIDETWLAKCDSMSTMSQLIMTKRIINSI